MLLTLLLFAITSTTADSDHKNVNLDYSDFHYYTLFSADGDRVEFDFTVIQGGNVDIYIMSSTEYRDRYSENKTFSYSYAVRDINNLEDSWEQPDDQTYYFVIDNWDNAESHDTEPTGDVTYDLFYDDKLDEKIESFVSSIDDSEVLLACACCGAIIIILIIGILNLGAKKRKKSSVVMVQPSHVSYSPLQNPILQNQQQPQYRPHGTIQQQQHPTYERSYGQYSPKSSIGSYQDSTFSFQPLTPRSFHTAISSSTLLGGYLQLKRLPLELIDQTVDLVRECIEKDLHQDLSPLNRFKVFLVIKQLAYLLHPRNEWLRDLIQNHKDSLKFTTYFDIPHSPLWVLSAWGLPLGLEGRVHLDSERKRIVEKIIGSPFHQNFIIIGEPGVGKTAMLFHVFNSMMRKQNAALILPDQIGKYHESEGIRLFLDDAPKNEKTLQQIARNGIAGIVTSAREKDWNNLPYMIQQRFTRLTVKNFSPTEAWKLLNNLLEVTSVTANEDSKSLLVDVSEGSPIFMWTLLVQLRQSGSNELTTSFIRENASRGMLNYIGDILSRLLKDGDRFRPGGFHGLVMLYLLATHFENQRCSVAFFLRISEMVSRIVEQQFNYERGIDPKNPGLILSVLLIQNEIVQFPHDYWSDLMHGKGERNPFQKDLVYIRRDLSDSGYFEEVKRACIGDCWKEVLDVYSKNPIQNRDVFLAFCDTLLSNFTIMDLKSAGVDIETIRETVALYSHLPQGERLFSTIERTSPRVTQQVIEIRDSVIMKSRIG